MSLFARVVAVKLRSRLPLLNSLMVLSRLGGVCHGESMPSGVTAAKARGGRLEVRTFFVRAGGGGLNDRNASHYAADS